MMSGFSWGEGEKAVTCVKTEDSPRLLVWVKHMNYLLTDRTKAAALK